MLASERSALSSEEPKGKSEEERIRRLANKFAAISDDERRDDPEFLGLTEEDIAALADYAAADEKSLGEEFAQSASEAYEAYGVFLRGDSTLNVLGGNATLDALFEAVREMEQHAEGRARLFDAVVTAVARDATFFPDEETPLGAAYKAYEDEAMRRSNQERRKRRKREG
jgi:hypothetical protein